MTTSTGGPMNARKISALRLFLLSSGESCNMNSLNLLDSGKLIAAPGSLTPYPSAGVTPSP